MADRRLLARSLLPWRSLQLACLAPGQIPVYPWTPLRRNQQLLHMTRISGQSRMFRHLGRFQADY